MFSSTLDFTRCKDGLCARDAEALVELVVEKAAAGFVGLEPFAVDDELRNSALAGVADSLGRGGRVGILIEFREFDPVCFEKLNSRPAISAP